MFIKKTATVDSSSNFDLKHLPVQLIQPAAAAQSVDISLQQLESMRVARRALSASRHGLEVICGGSCETGAQ